MSLQKALSKTLDDYTCQSFAILLFSSEQGSNPFYICLCPSCRFLDICSPFHWFGLDNAECQVALTWWLGLDTSGGSTCPFCPDTALDPLGHHAATCRHGGNVVSQHNHLCDIFADFCHQAHLSVKVEVGYGLSRDHINSRPADILVQSWDRGKPATFDVRVASLLLS